jgi:radical SAM protein with 4Fe4S-binding SPASM domain
MDLPTFLQMEPVGQCNLRCEMCPIQFRNDGPLDGSPAFMNFDTFSTVLDQFRQIDHLHLQGLGEPMMHPRFFDMVALAAGRGIRVTTNTNLTLSSPKRAERCIDSGLKSIYVSIDGASPEVYASIRKGGRLSRVLQNIDDLNEARRRRNSSLPNLSLVTVIMRRNLPELADLVRLAGGRGIKSMFVQHLCHDFGESTLPADYLPMRDFVDEETLLHEDSSRVEASFAEAAAVARQLDVDLRLPSLQSGGFPQSMKGRERCDWPWRGAYVSYQGYVMPCCMISTPDRLNFGNVSSAPLPVIWSGEDYDAFRDRLASDRPPEICRACSVYRGIF